MKNLDIKKRKGACHHEAKKIRKEGKVPGVFYGNNIKGFNFEIGELELNDCICSGGINAVVNVSMEGENHKAIIKEIQRDAITRKIIHVDLENIDNKKEVTANIPVNFTGRENLTKHGAIVQRAKETIKVKGDADSLPKSINFDLSKAKNKEAIRISNLEIASELTVLDDIETILGNVRFEKKLANDSESI
ncbi:MAG: 50S ribosomal protein L25 [Sarcina sp.]